MVVVGAKSAFSLPPRLLVTEVGGLKVKEALKQRLLPSAVAAVASVVLRD